jgi:ubiquinone/menaquinone biosynthesis C-methylase UbiE
MTHTVTPIPPSRMNCDWIAPYYQTLEHLSFGGQLERSRFAFLSEVQMARRAIVCGGGDGRFLARLLQANPRVQVDFVDLSERMIQLARKRVASLGPAFQERVWFYQGDIATFEPSSGGYDLIVTNFFLDCFTDAELAEVVSRLASWGTPEGRWIVSDFRQAKGLAGRIWTSAIICGLYAAFRITTGLSVSSLPNYVAALQRQGFQLCWEERTLGGLLYSSLWQVCPSTE